MLLGVKEHTKLLKRLIGLIQILKRVMNIY